MTSMTSESPHRHMPEPARISDYNGLEIGPEWDTIAVSWITAFAHVLNVPVSEDIWPGEAVDLFLQPFFAKSLDTGEFVQQGKVYEHMRCETLRLCSARYSAKDYMEDELAFYYEFDGPSPFGFSDSSDDEGELLLTDELDW